MQARRRSGTNQLAERRGRRAPLALGIRRLGAGSFIAACLASTALGASVNWVGTTGNWNVATNWSGGAFPGAADDVTMSVSGGTVESITFNGVAPVTTATVNTLSSNENLVVSGGTLTVTGAYTNTAATTISGGTRALNGTSVLATLSQSNGSLAGTGTVTVTGGATITFGDHRGTGTTVLQGASTISSSGFRLDGGARSATKGR